MFRSMLERLAAYRRRQREMAELYGLDDRSLADLGITRSEIPYLLARAEEQVSAQPKAPFKAFRHA